MKKFFKKILLFFVLVFMVDICVGHFGEYLQAHAKRGTTKRTNDLVMKDCYDVVILGSSRAHHSYDAPYLSNTLGIDVYNAGYDGNGVILSYGLLELMLERYQPRLVLFDVEPTFDINVYQGDNHHTRYINMLKPYYNHDAVGRLIRDVSLEEWLKVHSGLIRYNSVLIAKGVDNFAGSEVDQKGFAPLYGIYQGINESLSNKEEQRDKFKLKYMERLIKLCLSNNIKIAIVASPKLYENNSEIMKPVKSLCKIYSVPFLDYYTDTTFTNNPQKFNDPSHLNVEGARLFSEKLVDFIQKQL